MVAWRPGTVTPDPRYLPTRDQEAANLCEMADTLAEAGAELLILEMMLDVERARLAVEAAVATGLPVWVGMSCTRRADGELVGWDVTAKHPQDDYVAPDPPALETIIDELMEIGGQVAGVMHSSIADTTPGLDILFQRWSGPVMAYPETTGVDLGTQVFADHCRGWVENGVQIIGGCCGTTIDHIRAMVDELPPRVSSRAAT